MTLLRTSQGVKTATRATAKQEACANLSRNEPHADAHTQSTTRQANGKILALTSIVVPNEIPANNHRRRDPEADALYKISMDNAVQKVKNPDSCKLVSCQM